MIDFQILNEQKIQHIIDAAYRILENIGVEVHNDEAIQILKKLGCSIDDTRVFIPRAIIENAIVSAPSSFPVYDRNGRQVMELGGRNSYYGAGPTCPNFFDPRTGKRRPAVKQDAADTALVSDALPEIDYVMSLCMIGDHTRELADLHEVDAILRNSVKPICTWAFNGHNTQRIIDMCAAVKGNLEALQKKPFLIIYAEPSTPLMHSKDALDKVIVLAKNRIPCIYTPGMLLGGTAPVTLAGAMSVGIAECLTGLVIHQYISAGAPFIAGCGGSPMDMKQMKPPYGSPENILIHGASSEVWRQLGLPSFGLAGATDAKTVDAQAGFEAALQIFISGACGGNLIHDVGFMDYGLTGSCHQLVFCNEVISHARRLFQGIDVDEEHLAFATIKNVGPGGNFIGEEHTFKYFRTETWSPEISERRSFEDWAASGGKDLRDVVAEKLINILDTHQPQALNNQVSAKLDAIIAEEEASMQS